MLQILSQLSYLDLDFSQHLFNQFSDYAVSLCNSLK